MPSLAHAQAMYEIVICKVFSNLISVIHFCSRSRVDGRPPRHTRDKSRPSYTMGKKSPLEGLKMLEMKAMRSYKKINFA